MDIDKGHICHLALPGCWHDELVEHITSGNHEEVQLLLKSGVTLGDGCTSVMQSGRPSLKAGVLCADPRASAVVDITYVHCGGVFSGQESGQTQDGRVGGCMLHQPSSSSSDAGAHTNRVPPLASWSWC